MQKDIAQKDSERKRQKEKNIDKKTASSDPPRQLFPQRRYLPSGRITVPDQKLKFMGHQYLELPDLIAWPPPKPPPAQPLLTKPEPLTIIADQFNRCPSLVAKDKQITQKWICL